MSARGERLRLAIDALEPRDDADRRGLEAWLETIAVDYVSLRDRIQGHPTPGELHDELLELAAAAKQTALLLRRLGEPALDRLRCPLGLSGTTLDRHRQHFGEWHRSPVDRVKGRLVGNRRTGEGLWFDLRALAALAEREAHRIPVTRQGRREGVAGFGDTRRDLVVACGNVVFSRGLAVRAIPLAELSAAVHERAEGQNDDRDNAAFGRFADEVAALYERLRAEYDRHTAAGILQRPETHALATGFGAPVMELHRKLRLVIGLPPEGEAAVDEGPGGDRPVSG